VLPIVELLRAVEPWFAAAIFFECPAVLQIGRDPGRPEAVVAELCADAGSGGTPADRSQQVSCLVPRPIVRNSGSFGSSPSLRDISRGVDRG
jgi:hypothetical protein